MKLKNIMEWSESLTSNACDATDALDSFQTPSSGAGTETSSVTNNETASIIEQSGIEDRTGHIPYILNGELYAIQSRNGENVTVKCVHCPPDRIYRGSVRSTGNFHMHIKRRHTELLGKLHEMKVSALLERRDRILKNRTLKRRSSERSNFVNIKEEIEESLPVTQTQQSPSTSKQTLQASLAETQSQPLPKKPLIRPSLLQLQSKSEPNEMPDLKIKTVFQRHQQQEAMRNLNSKAFVVGPDAMSEEAEAIDYSVHSTVMDDLTAEQSSQQVNETPLTTQDSPDTSSITTMSSQNRNISTSLKTEVNDLPLDLSKTSSTVTVSSDIDSFGRVSPGSFLTNTFGVHSRPEDSMQQIQVLLGGIQDALRERNQIERTRILLEAAKFKYLYPTFLFE